MKITIVANYYPPHVGGLEIVAQNQAQMLTEAGHDVTVVTCSPTRAMTGTIDESGVAVHRVYANNFFERRFGIPFTIGGWGLARQIWKSLRSADLLMLHDVFYQISWIAYFYARILGKRFILIQHVGIVDHPSKLVDFVQRSVYRTIGRMIFKSASAIIVYNTIVKEFLLSSGVDTIKIHELSNGIDIDRFTPPLGSEKNLKKQAFDLPADKPIVLFVGRLVPKKGYGMLYDSRDEAYTIVFAGSGEVPKAWHESPETRFLGPVPQSELPDLYKAADVFVLPAQNESFTLAMQEAMSAGLPVLTLDNDSYRDSSIDREKILFIQPDPASIKSAISRVLSDQKLRTEMSSYSREYAQKNFNWRTNMRPVLSLIKTYEK